MSERNGGPTCRFCSAPLRLTVVDLGMSPPCQSFLSADHIREMEPFYPLHVFACERCYLVQLEVFVEPEDIFPDYAYFSAYATSWVEHARAYVETISERLELGPDDLVVELGRTTATSFSTSWNSGCRFSGSTRRRTSRGCSRAGRPDARRVLRPRNRPSGSPRRKAGQPRRREQRPRPVPDLNDFVAGVAILLATKAPQRSSSRTSSSLLERLEYDTIYHEHFSYFSLATFVDILGRHGLDVYDVEEFPTHGGSLRVYAQHEAAPARAARSRRSFERGGGGLALARARTRASQRT